MRSVSLFLSLLAVCLANDLNLAINMQFVNALNR